jgi:hypothetical protein
MVRVILRHLSDQDLPIGFPVSLPKGHTIMKCQVRWMISDLDSIRAALSLKGCAAMSHAPLLLMQKRYQEEQWFGRN